MPTEISDQFASDAPAQRLPCYESREWLFYFRSNTQTLLEIPWETGPEISNEERVAITTSLQGFQLGESSEGRNLVRCAKAYAEATGDADYFEAIVLFIKEEQRHARDLGRFMDLNGIPRIAETWPDTVFRFMRRGAGLELSVAVLVTAEIIAQVYYPALRAATQSVVLKSICDQIIQDETPHVRFQCERLGLLRSKRSKLLLAMTYACQRFLFLGTCVVVWQAHRKVLRRSVNGFRGFWQSAWARYFEAEAISRAVSLIQSRGSQIAVASDAP